MIRFWVKLMRDGSRVPWMQAAAEYFAPPIKYCAAQISRLRCIFPSLRLEDRKEFLFSVQCTKPDDFLLCMYSMTKGEENETLEGSLSLNLFVLNLLCAYSDLPLLVC
ncbi:hypothetical protein AVEN_46988-1 [Araneus ventricosus]|uniref:Uncharacterized protein n=1 Tax=Araneus ventricosus TaxID=182803 RepID=A0A4Y2IKX6_ARAVE|nr:hypothetical protein AVEN_46988-1 [Araneus ventricosus]